jgi:hypothetical protein
VLLVSICNAGHLLCVCRVRWRMRKTLVHQVIKLWHEPLCLHPTTAGKWQDMCMCMYRIVRECVHVQHDTGTCAGAGMSSLEDQHRRCWAHLTMQDTRLVCAWSGRMRKACWRMRY